MNDEEYRETQRLSQEFKVQLQPTIITIKFNDFNDDFTAIQNGCGRKLQRILVLRSWSPWTANYVSCHGAAVTNQLIVAYNYSNRLLIGGRSMYICTGARVS